METNDLECQVAVGNGHDSLEDAVRKTSSFAEAESQIGDGSNISSEGSSIWRRLASICFTSLSPPQFFLAHDKRSLDHAQLAPLELLKSTVTSHKDLVLQLTGDEADAFMSILQSALDEVDEVDDHRSHLLDTLLQLAINSGVVPKCLHVRGINNVDQFPIASGGFGDVWKGEWEERKVALKTVRAAILVAQNDDTIHRRLCKEVLLWRQLKHRHLLEFIGICNDILQSPAIVSPWMENGNVLQFVKLQPVALKLKLLSEVADALQYLHNQSPAIIHQDIRCANILVNDVSEAVLSDFGLSRIDNSLLSVNTSSIEHGCLRWQAPELVFADTPRPCTATDIYAFGMTGLEMLTEKPPFAFNATDPAVVMDLYHGRRPPRPSAAELPKGVEISDGMWSCLEACWSADADSRPNATDVRTRFLLEMETSRVEDGAVEQLGEVPAQLFAPYAEDSQPQGPPQQMFTALRKEIDVKNMADVTLIEHQKGVGIEGDAFRSSDAPDNSKNLLRTKDIPDGPMKSTDFIVHTFGEFFENPQDGIRPDNASHFMNDPDSTMPKGDSAILNLIRQTWLSQKEVMEQQQQMMTQINALRSWLVEDAESRRSEMQNIDQSVQALRGAVRRSDTPPPVVLYSDRPPPQPIIIRTDYSRSRSLSRSRSRSPVVLRTSMSSRSRRSPPRIVMTTSHPPPTNAPSYQSRSPGRSGTPTREGFQRGRSRSRSPVIILADDGRRHRRASPAIIQVPISYPSHPPQQQPVIILPPGHSRMDSRSRSPIVVHTSRRSRRSRSPSRSPTRVVMTTSHRPTTHVLRSRSSSRSLRGRPVSSRLSTSSIRQHSIPTRVPTRSRSRSRSPFSFRHASQRPDEFERRSSRSRSRTPIKEQHVLTESHKPGRWQILRRATRTKIKKITKRFTQAETESGPPPTSPTHQPGTGPQSGPHIVDSPNIRPADHTRSGRGGVGNVLHRRRRARRARHEDTFTHLVSRSPSPSLASSRSHRSRSPVHVVVPGSSENASVTLPPFVLHEQHLPSMVIEADAGDQYPLREESSPQNLVRIARTRTRTSSPRSEHVRASWVTWTPPPEADQSVKSSPGTIVHERSSERDRPPSPSQIRPLQPRRHGIAGHQIHRRSHSLSMAQGIKSDSIILSSPVRGTNKESVTSSDHARSATESTQAIVVQDPVSPPGEEVTPTRSQASYARSSRGEEVFAGFSYIPDKEGPSNANLAGYGGLTDAPADVVAVRRPNIDEWRTVVDLVTHSSRENEDAKKSEVDAKPPVTVQASVPAQSQEIVGSRAPSTWARRPERRSRTAEVGRYSMFSEGDDLSESFKTTFSEIPAVEEATPTRKFVLKKNLKAIEGKDGMNFVRLEEVHGVKITVLPAKDGEDLQEILVETSDERPSRCDDAGDEIDKLNEFYERFGSIREVFA